MKLKISAGRARAELYLSHSELSVQIYQEPHMGSPEHMIQIMQGGDTNHPQAEPTAYLRVRRDDTSGRDRVLGALHRAGISPATLRGQTQAQLDSLFSVAFDHHPDHSPDPPPGTRP